MHDYHALIECQMRPVKMADLDAIYTLAKHAKSGLTSLPKNKALLDNQLQEACSHYQDTIDKPGTEKYIFVLEQQPHDTIIGTSNISATVGKDTPFYQYHKKQEKFHSPTLGKTMYHTFLQLETLNQPVSEIGGLYLLPTFRQRGVGRFLSLSRFLFIAAHMKQFRSLIIAEMRGVGDDNSVPFWEALGRKYFECEFSQADLISTYNKSFIEALLPKYPIHTALLPQSVQTIIGQVHDMTLPALNLLLAEQFTFTDCIDIFDGGPKLECQKENIRTIAHSYETQIALKQTLGAAQSELCMLLVYQENEPIMMCRYLEFEPEGTVYGDFKELDTQCNYWITPLYYQHVKEGFKQWELKRTVTG